MRATLFLSALLAVALGAPAAQARDHLVVVGPATVHPDARTVHVTLRCDAPRARCAGRLAVAAFDTPLVRPRSVRLTPRRATRLVLRLDRRGLGRLGLGHADEKLVDVTLTPRHASHLVGSGGARPRPSCRSGQTLARAPAARVFRLAGFGVYVCSDPHRRPRQLVRENTGFEPTVVRFARAAGPYVAYVQSGGVACADSLLAILDVRTGHVVRTLRALNALPDPDDDCAFGTAIRALVLRPSGAAAWVEDAGDTGLAAVRAVDPDGTVRTLDVAPRIDAPTLRLADPGRVTWQRGDGATGSAPLA
jgi:hypothetical protein